MVLVLVLVLVLRGLASSTRTYLRENSAFWKVSRRCCRRQLGLEGDHLVLRHTRTSVRNLADNKQV